LNQNTTSAVVPRICCQPVEFRFTPDHPLFEGFNGGVNSASYGSYLPVWVIIARLILLVSVWFVSFDLFIFESKWAMYSLDNQFVQQYLRWSCSGFDS
jgi:hypothetical protein